MSAAARFALDVALAWLMPWRAVRALRDSRSSFATLCEVFVRQGERLERYEPKPRERHLHLVK